MWASCSPSVPVTARCSLLNRDGLRCRAEAEATHPDRRKVIVVGAGWAGLASAHHLSKQGFDVTLLEAGSGPAPEAGIKGFWYPYRNIFSVIDEVGIRPFTEWTRSAHYSPEGMEAEFPVFQDLPRLPTPFAILSFPQFSHLSLVDRLTSVRLIAAVIDFDNTDTAWRKYDAMTARELFKQFGCSERLYQKALEPLLQVGLLAPAEQCSAAATLGMLYYYILAHQGKMIILDNFQQIPKLLGSSNGRRSFIRPSIILTQFLKQDVVILLLRWPAKLRRRMVPWDSSGKNPDAMAGVYQRVLCGQEIYEADAFVLAVGVSTLQSIVISSSVLQSRKEFLNTLNLAAIDVVSVKLWLDRKVKIPNVANVCFGFDDLTGWTFFDLNSIFDGYEEEPATILEAEFYYSNKLLPLKDEEIVAKVMSYLSRCIKEFKQAIVLQQTINRFPKSATHFFPGSYKYMMRGSTTFPNLFMAGDWIVTRHGSWSQEKAYVTGLEAANRVVDYLGEGDFAQIIPVEDDEPHTEALRSLNRSLNEIRTQLPLSDYFL